MRSTFFEADDTCLNKMWDIQINKNNHRKNLQTIYRQKEQIKKTSTIERIQRNKALSLCHRNKIADSQRKAKQLESKIMYQNDLLYKKLASLEQKKQSNRKLFSVERFNYSKHAQSINLENQRIMGKLINVKSQIQDKLRIKQHSKIANILKQRVQKKSPKKKAYLQYLLKKKFNESNNQTNFPNRIHLISIFQDKDGNPLQYLQLKDKLI